MRDNEFFYAARDVLGFMLAVVILFFAILKIGSMI